MTACADLRVNGYVDLRHGVPENDVLYVSYSTYHRITLVNGHNFLRLAKVNIRYHRPKMQQASTVI